ncbi:hypothetical protein TNCV_2319681 [Trichonephila clavipes]|nr:hypothetical protein TNCV_2319681 [Trichonephila clavipes]
MVITAEIESGFVAKDDRVPFRCSPVSSCAALLQTEVSIRGRQGQHTVKGTETVSPGTETGLVLMVLPQSSIAVSDADCGAVRSRFESQAQNEIAVVPDFRQPILFSDESALLVECFVNKQNHAALGEVNPQSVYRTPLHPEKAAVLLLYGLVGSAFKENDEGHNVTINDDLYRP